MKLTFVALSLLPASLAFAPAGSRTMVRTESSSRLHGWFQDIFADRSDTAEKEKEVIADRFTNSIKAGLEGDFLPPTPEEEAASHKVKLMGEEDFKHMPTHSQTGVDLHICRLAATISSQLYEIHDGRKDDFMLNTDEHKTDVILRVDQDVFKPTNPPFCACVSGDTMILGWRGSVEISDFINDIAWSPTSNIAMRKHAKNVKVQGAMASLCLNDIALHEKTIIEECKKRGIKEIVTTGHSLGGGIGQIAHTIIRAQMQDEGSPWSELEGVNVRSVVFCAPMTTVILEEGCSKETEKFIDELNDNSCNVVFFNDFVPRAYGYVSFINDWIDDVVPAIGPYLLDGKRMPSFFIKKKIEQVAELQKEKAENAEVVQDIVSVLHTYIHPGKIAFYENEEAKPKTLVDMGAFDKNAGKRGTFRSVKYTPINKRDKKRPDNPIDEEDYCHGAGRDGIAYDDEFLH